MINMKKHENIKTFSREFYLIQQKGNNYCLPHSDVWKNVNVASICFAIEEDIE